MSIFNPFAIGFVCVAASAVVGVDYVMQSKAAGSNPGEYAFSTYLEGYGIRVDDTVDFIDKTRRQSVEAREHLPMEPQGWVRTEWDIGAIDIDAVTAGMGIVERMASKEERRKAISLANYEAWEYRKGNQIVRISASFEEAREPSDTAIPGQLTGEFFPIEEPTYRPFKVVGNVPFLKVTDAENPEAVSQTLLEARMGDEILIAVSSEVGPEDLLGLLQQIDFNNLNLMMSEPLSYVGDAAPVLTDEQQMTLAGLTARAWNQGESVTDEMVAAAFGGEVVLPSNDRSVAGLQKPDPIKPAANTTRIELSGGRSCLSGSSRLCD